MACCTFEVESVRTTRLYSISWKHIRRSPTEKRSHALILILEGVTISNPFEGRGCRITEAAGIRSALDKAKSWKGHCGYPPVVRSCEATQDSWRACPPPPLSKNAKQFWTTSSYHYETHTSNHFPAMYLPPFLIFTGDQWIA